MLVGGLAWGKLAVIIKSGFFRGFAGLCIGGIIYELSEKLSSKVCRLTDRIIFTCAEIGSFFLSICIAWKGSGVTNSTFLVVLLLFVGLTISFSNQSYTSLLNIKFFGKLGTISTSLYVSHFSVGKIVGMYSDYFNVDIFWRYIIYFAMSFLTAIVMVMINKKIQ